MLEIVISLFFTAIASCIFYYLACIHRDSYWKNRGIPGPKGDVIFGNLKSLINPNYPSVLQLRDWAKQYGKFYGIREGWRHVLIISDPKLVHELLVTKFEYFHGRKSNPLVGNVDKEKRTHVFSARGLRWKRLRNISSPSFNVTNLKKIMGTVDDSVNVMMMHLKKISETGESFNIHPYCHELTMDIICRIALGQKGTHQFENPYTDEAKRIFSSLGISWFNIFAYLFPWDSSVWLLKRISLLTAGIRKAPFKEIVDKLYKIVEERKKLREEGKNDHNDGKVDFIDLFLNAEVNEMPDQNVDYKHKVQIKVSKTMTTDEIVAQCFVFLLAGFDTTANTLANTIFFLAKDPERQKILQDEIDELCPDENVTYEQLQSLKYEDAVMKEALRMVPIAAFAASRECAETTTLGEITIEKGTYVAVDVFSLHYDKEIWGNDADKFIPERFLDNENRHPGSWIPFGGGPRTCIGMRLAYLEEKLALVKILKEYDIVACAETEKVLKFVGAAILNPESVTIKLVKRK